MFEDCGPSGSQKLDCFVCALVPDVRLQVELREPRDFHEAAMLAEGANVVIPRISGQDSRRNWQHKQYKSPPLQHPPPLMKTSVEISAPKNTGPKPMELGIACRRTLTKEEYPVLRAKNANVGHMAHDYPWKNK